MMSSNVGPGYDNVGDSSSGELLLRDIEAISKALYLDRSPPKGFVPPSNVRSKSVHKTSFADSKTNSKLRVLEEESLRKDKKSSIWNWRPLKALTHIRTRRFNCCFFLHVHSIQGLPPSFNDFSLRVHWERKEGLQTCPSRVYQGMAEFEETLMDQCSVYGSRNGPRQTAKYEAKHFLLYASVIGVPGLDIGKHRIDLTNLLPLTFEELEEDKSLGKWTTSFKLSGKAKGATLNVGFGFLVMGDNSFQSTSNLNVPDLLNLSQNRLSSVRPIGRFSPNDGNGTLRRVGSVPGIPNHGFHISSQSMDVKCLHKILPNPGLGLSGSINFLYEKLDEEKTNSSAESDLFIEHVKPLKPKPDTFSESGKELIGNECDDTQFTIIERGIEFSMKEHLKLEEGAAQITAETIHVDEIIKDDKVSLDDERKCNSKDEIHRNFKDAALVNDCQYGENNAYSNESSVEELESAFHDFSILASVDLDFPAAMSEFLEQECNEEVKPNYKAGKMVKSCSLDDITESVASDFLNMLGIEHSPVGLSSDSDPDSPRECLLRQFEKDVIASGNFTFDFDAGEEQSEFSFSAPTRSGWEEFSEEFDFSSVIQVAEKDHERRSQALKSRRSARILEDLETKALMQDWGLSEEAFQSSPRYSSGGFGSPIYLPPKEPLQLPSLGEGLGPFVQCNDGGFLRSMSPSLFRNAENGGRLIMQASGPVVLPAEMGSGIMEILQHLASAGIEKLSMQAKKLMPLEDITGKNMQQVARDAAPRKQVPARETQLQHESGAGQDSFGGEKNAEWFPFAQDYDDLNSSSMCGETDSDFVSLEDLAPLAMGKIEVLSIEGLRIQSGMSAEQAPSRISLNSAGETSAFDGRGANFNGFSLKGADGLLGLSITLDEWMKLDAGFVGDEYHISERISKILAAHHAKHTDLTGERLERDGKWGRAFGRNCGFLGNNLTVALMVQLRDPIRNHEPIGAPMFAIIQAERVLVPLKSKICSRVSERSNNWEEENQHGTVVCRRTSMQGKNDGIKEKRNEEGDISQFKLAEVHLAGLNIGPSKKHLWGTTIQQQSGSRWLVASGIGKINKHPFSKSKAILKFSPQVLKNVQPGDTMWSISSCVHGTGAEWKELAALNSHIRNPDVIFSNETIRL